VTYYVQEISPSLKNTNVYNTNLVCDGYMIARGAIHNVEMFNEYKDETFELEEKELDNDYNEDINYVCVVGKGKNNSVAVSTKLASVFEDKYGNRDIDIIRIVKDYVELAIKSGNNFFNTKYTSLYMLKTHKKHFDLFNKIQTMKFYDEIWYNLFY
jgi:tRNA-dihydrouridine synthase